MCEALFNILFNYSLCNVNERGCGIDLFNSCRTTLGDNSIPDIRNNIYTTAPLLFPLPLMLVPMSGDEIYPKNRQIKTNA
jgi:hypothetical protein